MRTSLGAICLITIVLYMPGSAQRVSQTAPMPNRTITAPSAQRPAGGDHPESTAGTIEGFVYWDAHQFSHVPAGSCSGLAVTVAVGSSSGGPLVAYTPLATLTNNFKYVGQVKEFLVGGKVNVYDVCTYGYDHVPVGPDLQVKLTVTQPGVFTGCRPSVCNSRIHQDHQRAVQHAPAYCEPQFVRSVGALPLARTWPMT